MKTVFIVYLIIINITAFFVFFADKHYARRKMYRISEKRLLLLALCGGSVGALLAMYIFRHKTKHLIFTLGIPLIIFLQIFLIWAILF